MARHLEEVHRVDLGLARLITLTVVDSEEVHRVDLVAPLQQLQVDLDQPRLQHLALPHQHQLLAQHLQPRLVVSLQVQHSLSLQCKDLI